MRTRPAASGVEAGLAGLFFGVVAQVLRQMDGSLMDLGAAKAPWVTIGFAIAVWATRSSRPLRNAAVVGTVATAAYLIAWLLSYHVLFGIRESVGLGAAWREAAPWLAVVGPACLILGALAAFAHRRGVLGDACLAAPVAWSLPEVVVSVREGSWGDIAVAAAIAVLAVLPTLAAARRDVRLVTVVVSSLVLAALVLALSSVILSQIRS